MVLKANDTSTRATGRSTGHPVRALKSPFTNAYAKSEGSGASAEELGAMGTGALRKAAKDGNYEEGSFFVWTDCRHGQRAPERTRNR